MKAMEKMDRKKKAGIRGWRQRLMVFLLCLLPLMFAATGTALAAEATLAWDPSTGSVAGYKLYYGLASGSYSNEINVGNVTQYTVTGLQDGKAYYFAVKAYDASGNYSDFSNELECFTLTASAGANGSISPSGTVILSRGASKSFAIAPAAGFGIAGVMVDGASAGAVSTYTFSNVTATHTISASFAPIAYTITASAGANGGISPSGTVQVAHGGSQAFSIAAATGYKVADVLVDGASVGAVTSYTFTNVTSARTISATFSQLNYNITASAGANGNISPSGTVQVAHGGSQAFSITPATGYKVADVLVDGASVGAVSSYIFGNVTAARTISASFAPLTYTITASSGSNGTISPSGATQVNHGGSQAFSITPATGYKVADVLVDGASVGAVTSYTFTNVTAARTISATFSQLSYNITASAGANGSISPSGTVQVAHGGSKTFTITPSSNYKIAGVLVDGISVGPVTSYTFSNVTASRTISASFEASPFYTITATAGANGAINPSGTVQVSPGGSQSFSITPASGYKVADVLVDGSSVGAVTSYTFTNIASSRTISVSFTPSYYTISATAGSNGAISPSGTIQVSPGGSQSFSISPASGYKIADVLVDGASVGAVASYTFSNIAASRTISASFTAIGYTITSSAGANGSISPSGTVEVSHGGSKGFTITPSNGYKIADVLVDGQSVGAISSYTFNNVTASHSISVSFKALTFTITAGAGANGAISPSGTIQVNYGDSKAFTITPSTGYKVADVLVDGASVGAVTTYTFTNIAASRTISASFEASPFYTITATAGANGAITPSGTVQVSPGASQAFIISPANGYKIADVLVDGVSAGAVSAYTFSNVTKSGSISASFSALKYVIKSSARAAGTITPSGTVEVIQGASQTFKIKPKTGYQISNVLVDGVSIGAVSSYTFGSVLRNHMISAGFTRISTKKSRASLKDLYDFRDRKTLTSSLLLSGTGYDPGFGGWVDMLTPEGDMDRSAYLPWPEYIELSGEMRLATGDLDGDGKKEIVVGLGPVEGVEGIPGGYFAVLDTGYTLKAWGRIPWDAYNSLNGETRPACGDLDGDGKDEIVIGLGPGGQGKVSVFRFEQNAVNHVKWLETGWEDYNALNGEIRPACPDLDGDGIAEVVVGLGRIEGASAAPDGMYLVLNDVLGTNSAPSGTPGSDVSGWGKIDWNDYNLINGELWPAKADTNGDGREEIVLGLGLEGGGRFTVVDFDLKANLGTHLVWQQTTWPEFHQLGVEVRPAGGNIDYDRYDEIVLGFGSGSRGFLETFDDAIHNYEHIARIDYVDSARSGKGVETWPAVLD